MNLKVLARVKETAVDTALSRGLTLTDYVCLLIAEDNRDRLPSTVVPMRQEVLKLRDSA